MAPGAAAAGRRAGAPRAWGRGAKPSAGRTTKRACRSVISRAVQRATRTAPSDREGAAPPVRKRLLCHDALNKQALNRPRLCSCPCYSIAVGQRAFFRSPHVLGRCPRGPVGTGGAWRRSDGQGSRNGTVKCCKRVWDSGGQVYGNGTCNSRCCDFAVLEQFSTQVQLT